MADKLQLPDREFTYGLMMARSKQIQAGRADQKLEESPEYKEFMTEYQKPTHEKLLAKGRAVEKLLNQWYEDVRKVYKPGMIVRWKGGKYEGRLAKIRYVYPDIDVHSGPSIGVTVATQSLRGGYLDDNDYYHRIIRDIENFEVTNIKVPA